MDKLHVKTDEDRLVYEEKFHDDKYSNNSGPLHYSMLNPTFKIFTRMLNSISDIKGKKILECGCGDGWVTAELATLGAVVYAFDISNESVKATNNFLTRKNIAENCFIEKKSAEAIDYPDDTFDFVIGFAILHHVDLLKTIPQIHRVLKTNGIAIFAEPLAGNPLLNIYRRLTPQYRTPDEVPLKIEEFMLHLKEFRNFHHEEFYLTSLLPLFMSNFRFIRPSAKTLQYFVNLDVYLFNKFSSLRKLAWYSILKFQK